MNDSSSPKKPLLLQRRHFLGLSVGLAANMLFAQHLHAAQETAPLPPRKPRPPRLIMIDPGHGGHDPGAIGKRGTFEKDVTLDVAQRMAERLSQMKGVTAKLTRREDMFLPLKERVGIARMARADFFVSIHADSAPTPLARGLSAYSLSEKASDAFSRQLAQRENSVDDLGGVDLTETEPDVAAILRDLTVRHTRNAALRAKKNLVRGMEGKWRLLDNPMRAADFAVLRAPDVPSLLVETGFLSNAKDEAILRDTTQRQRIANLLAGELGGILTRPPFA
jgi:N-acetylmuramoyl-L-alanine amidase